MERVMKMIVKFVDNRFYVKFVFPQTAQQLIDEVD